MIQYDNLAPSGRVQTGLLNTRLNALSSSQNFICWFSNVLRVRIISIGVLAATDPSGATTDATFNIGTPVDSDKFLDDVVVSSANLNAMDAGDFYELSDQLTNDIVEPGQAMMVTISGAANISGVFHFCVDFEVIGVREDISDLEPVGSIPLLTAGDNAEPT